MRHVRKASFSAEELVKVGRAPLCADCTLFMAPLNREDDPSLCRCPKCGKEGHIQWVH